MKKLKTSPIKLRQKQQEINNRKKQIEKMTKTFGLSEEEYAQLNEMISGDEELQNIFNQMKLIISEIAKKKE